MILSMRILSKAEKFSNTIPSSLNALFFFVVQCLSYFRRYYFLQYVCELQVFLSITEVFASTLEYFLFYCIIVRNDPCIHFCYVPLMCTARKTLNAYVMPYSFFYMRYVVKILFKMNLLNLRWISIHFTTSFLSKNINFVTFSDQCKSPRVNIYNSVRYQHEDKHVLRRFGFVQMNVSSYNSSRFNLTLPQKVL